MGKYFDLSPLKQDNQDNLQNNIVQRRTHFDLSSLKNPNKNITENFENTVDVDSNRQNEVEKIAKEIGQDVDYVNSNFEQIKKLKDTVPTDKELDEIKETPNTYDLMKNKEDVALIKDDYKNLSKFEKVLKGLVSPKSKFNPINTLLPANFLATNENTQKFAKTVGRAFVGGGIDLLSGLARGTISVGARIPELVFSDRTITKYDKEQGKFVNIPVKPEYEFNLGKEDEELKRYIQQEATNLRNKANVLNEVIKEQTEKFLKDTGLAKTDKDGFVYDLAQGFSSLLASIGITALSGGVGAGGLAFGLYQFQNVYEEAKQKGKDELNSLVAGITSGSFEAGLESLGLHMFIEGLKVKKVWTKFLKGFGVESIQEGSQQFFEELITNLFGIREESRAEILGTVGYSALIGGLVGSSVSLAHSGVEKFSQKQQENRALEIVNKAVKLEQTDMIANNLKAVGEVAKQVKTVTRNPQMAEKFVEKTVGKDTPVFISANALNEVLNQENEIKEKVLQQLGISNREQNVSADTDSNIKIPLAKWMIVAQGIKLSNGTTLFDSMLNDTKLDESGYTLTEKQDAINEINRIKTELEKDIEKQNQVLETADKQTRQKVETFFNTILDEAQPETMNDKKWKSDKQNAIKLWTAQALVNMQKRNINFDEWYEQNKNLRFVNELSEGRRNIKNRAVEAVQNIKDNNNEETNFYAMPTEKFVAEYEKLTNTKLNLDKKGKIQFHKDSIREAIRQGATVDEKILKDLDINPEYVDKRKFEDRNSNEQMLNQEDEIRPRIANDNETIEPLTLDQKKLVPNKKTLKGVAKVREYILSRKDFDLLGEVPVDGAGTTLVFSVSNIKRGAKVTRSNYANRQFYVELKQAVKRALYGGFIETDGKEKHSSILGQDVYFTSIYFNGKTYAVEIKADVLKTQYDEKYNYAGHRVKEVNIKEIELNKEKTGSNQGLLSPIYASGNISIAQFKKIFNNKFVEFKTEKQLIKEKAIADGTFLKAPNGKQSNLSENLWLTVRTDSFKNWFGDWENNPQKASKIVDENGEPKVCYHGTPLSRKQKTKNTGWYTDENGEEHYRRQEAPFNIFRGGAYNGLIFFSTDRAKAREIADYRSMHIQDDENGNEQWTEEGYVYDVFLNAKKPLNVANKKVINKILDSIDNIEAYDFYTNKLTKITKDEAAEILSGNNSWMVAETKQFLDAIKTQGYDALQAKDEGVEYTAVFKPNQIKSINNRGTFDTNTEDIYFQKGIKQGTKIVNWTNKFVSKTNSKGKKIPTIETVKHYIQEIIDKGRDFVTLDPNWKVDVANDSYVKNHIVYPKDTFGSKLKRYNKYIIGLKELLANAVYTGSGQVKPHGSKKTLSHKKKVKLYHYFVVNVEIGGHLYEIKLHTEEFKGDNTNKPQKVHLYAITENILYQKNSPTSETNTPVDDQSGRSGTNDIIGQDNLFVNKEKATNKIVRGFIVGDEIHVTPASDISTYIHEMGHYWLRDLQNYVLSGQATDEVLKEWATIKTWLNITDDTKHLTREQQETYARGLETYMMEGKAPSISLRNIFRKISNLMKYIYKRLTFEKVELSRDVHDYFDRLFATEQEIAENLASMETDFNKFMQKQNEKLKQEYENVKQEAHQQAVEILVEETMKEKTEKYKQDIETKKQEFYDNAKKEVEENKLYIATQKAIKDTKLSADKLIKKHKENSFSQDEIVSLMNIVADNNLSSIDELIQNVEYFKEPQKVIDEIVNGLMQEYENKVNDPEFIKERAIEAVNNEKQIELLALEREILIYNFYKQDINKETAYTRSRQYRELVKEQVKNYLESMPISEAKRYYKYVQAQQRLNRQFSSALQKGDMQQAIQLQEKIVLNSELIRQSLQLRKEFEKKSKNIESFCEKKFYQNDNLVQVFNILNRFKLEHKQQKGYPVKERPTLAQYQQDVNTKKNIDGQDVNTKKNIDGQDVNTKKNIDGQDVNYGLLNLPEYLLNEKNEAQDLNDLTITQLRDVLDGLRQILHFDRLSNEMTVNGRKVEFETIVNELDVLARSNVDKKTQERNNKDVNKGPGDGWYRLWGKVRVPYKRKLIRKCVYNLIISTGIKLDTLIHKVDGKDTWFVKDNQERINRDIDNLVNKAKENKQATVSFGNVSDSLVEVAKNNNLDIQGYEHNIDTSSVNHIKKQHKVTDKELARGQVPITKEDLKKIPTVINDFDFVAFGGKTDRGLDAIVYGKNMSDGSFVYVEEARTDKKTLTTTTIYKHKKAGVNSNSFVKMLNNVPSNTGTYSVIEKKDIVNKKNNSTNRKDITFYNVFLEPAKRASDKENKMLKHIIEQYQNLIKLYDKNEWYDIIYPAENTKIYVGELGNSFAKQELICLLLNFGNESSRQRLLETPIFAYKGDPNNWNEQTLRNVFQKYLTEKDYSFVQGIWNILEELGQTSFENHKELTGTYPQRVKEIPFTLYKDGKGFNFKGGYYPLKCDRRYIKNISAKEKELSEALQEITHTFFKLPSTDKGYTLQRSKTKYPVCLEFVVFHQAVANQVHDVCFRKLIYDQNRLLSNETLIKTIQDCLGQEGLEQFKSQVRVYGTRESFVGDRENGEKIVNWFRMGVGASMLAFKPGIILQNLGNFLIYKNAIDNFNNTQVRKIWLKALELNKDLVFNTQKGKAIKEFICSKSQMMTDRYDNFNYTMKECEENIFEEKGRLAKLGNWLMVTSDNLSAVPAWIVAYEQGINELKLSDKQASDRADLLITRVVGSSRKMDQARFTRSSNTFAKLFNPFASFMLNELNRWNIEYNVFKKEKDFIRFAGFVVTRAFFAVISEVLSGRLPDFDDDDDALTAWLKFIEKSMFGYGLSMLPYIRTFFNGIVDSIVDGKRGFTNVKGQSSVFSNLDTGLCKPVKEGFLLLRAILSGDVKDGQIQQYIEDLIDAVLVDTHQPLIFNDWLFNAYDVFVNGMTPEFSDIFKRRPKKKRK